MGSEMCIRDSPRVALSVLWGEFGDDDHAHVLDIELLVEVEDRNAVVRSLGP